LKSMPPLTFPMLSKVSKTPAFEAWPPLCLAPPDLTVGLLQASWSYLLLLPWLLLPWFKPCHLPGNSSCLPIALPTSRFFSFQSVFSSAITVPRFQIGNT
jgi:hypothetical protein